MAVSSSVDFAQTFTELFTDARRELGVNAEEEPVDATESANAQRVMNRMLKAWELDGVYAWTETEGTLTLTASDPSYTFGSGGDFTTLPVEILQMRITRNSTDLEMTRMTRENTTRCRTRRLPVIHRSGSTTASAIAGRSMFGPRRTARRAR